MPNDLVDISKKWEAKADLAVAAIPATGGTFLSTKGGILSFGEERMPGNQVCVIILDAILENTAYEGKFDSDNPQPPRCYAFGRIEDQKEMAPHLETMNLYPDYFIPQADQCHGCPLNEYGSADTGRGKACQNRARLTLLPAGYYQPKGRSKTEFELDLFTDPDHYKTADLAFLKLPVLSVKKYFKFVNDVAAAHRRPPYGVFARIWLEPDEKAQFLVNFEVLDVIPDEIAEIIMQKNEDQLGAKMSGYQPPEARSTEPKVQGLRGLRR